MGVGGQMNKKGKDPDLKDRLNTINLRINKLQQDGFIVPDQLINEKNNLENTLQRQSQKKLKKPLIGGMIIIIVIALIIVSILFLPSLFQNDIKTVTTDEEIFTQIIDYGKDYPKGETASLGQVSYAKLKSGEILFDGQRVPTAPLSSYVRAVEIAGILKDWIEKGEFLLTEPQVMLPSNRKV